MTHPALEVSTEQPPSLTAQVATQRDQGLQMRLFAAPIAFDADLDLRVTDDLAGMYYIG